MAFYSDTELTEKITALNHLDIDIELSVHKFIQQFLSGYEHPLPTGGAAGSKIWVYWAQGTENMPPVVRACVNQLFFTHDERDIVLLDDNNIGNFVNIPGYCYDKLFTNDKTHFSDILRAALLAEYGGIWTDATCYPSGNLLPLYEQAHKSGFFAYKGPPGYPTILSNWFLAAPAMSCIPALLRDALYEYHRTHETIEHYFIFHIIFKALYNLDSAFRECFDKTFVLYNDCPHYLQKLMFTPFDFVVFNKLMQLSLVHKLTYKYDYNADYTGSYLDYIINKPPRIFNRTPDWVL